MILGQNAPLQFKLNVRYRSFVHLWRDKALIRKPAYFDSPCLAAHSVSS